jgi:phosphoglycerol transferase
MRNVWHLWVASYYLIPLYVLILLWTWKAVPIFFKYEANKFKVCLVNKKSIFAFVVLVILSPTAKYYIFIFSYLIVIAGIGASFYRNNSRHLITALILVLMAMFSIVKLQIPFWLENRNEHFCEQIQRIKPGQNISSYGDAERYGLKIVQMLLPVDNHRIDKLALLKNRYNKSNPLINENSTATLGIIGSIGFVFLMFGVLQHKKRLDILQKLGLLTIFSILFATIGGGSSLFSTLTYTFIPESFLTSSRSFNRISIYIACFSLVTMAYVLHKTFCGSKKKHVIAVLLSFLLLVIGVFDQTNLTMKITSGYRAAAREYESDRAFFNLVEKTVGHGAMIFQLPYLAHHRRLNKTLCYTDALKGYINTNSLIWSHGGDYDSYHGYWYRKISRLPAEEMIDLLRVYGFKGVVVDRKGYKKNKNAIEKELYRTLNSKPVISKNNRLVFFKIETKGKINVAQKKKINMKIYSEFLSKR